MLGFCFLIILSFVPYAPDLVDKISNPVHLATKSDFRLPEFILCTYSNNTFTQHLLNINKECILTTYIQCMRLNTYIPPFLWCLVSEPLLSDAGTLDDLN